MVHKARHRRLQIKHREHQQNTEFNSSVSHFQAILVLVMAPVVLPMSKIIKSLARKELDLTMNI